MAITEFDTDAWRAANPALGITVSDAAFRARFEQAVALQPTPRELWAQAHGDPDWYRQLMAWHGYEPEPDVPDTWPRR